MTRDRGAARRGVRPRPSVVEMLHHRLSTAEGLAVKDVQGKGHGLVATRSFATGEKLFEASAFGFALMPGAAECCAYCLRFTVCAVSCACGIVGRAYTYARYF